MPTPSNVALPRQGNERTEKKRVRVCLKPAMSLQLPSHSWIGRMQMLLLHYASMDLTITITSSDRRIHLVIFYLQKSSASQAREKDHGNRNHRGQTQSRDHDTRSSTLGSRALVTSRGSLGHRARPSRRRARALDTSILGARAFETRSLASTLGHVLLSRARNGREIVAADVPGGALRRALRGRTVGLGAAVAGGAGGVLVGRLERGEVLVLGDGVAVDLDEAVAVAFFGVFVDETAAVDGCHLVAVEGGDFLELTGVGDAAVFRQAGKMISLVAIVEMCK